MCTKSSALVRATIIFKKIGSVPLLQTLKALILKPLIRKPFSRYTGSFSRL